MQHHIPSSSPEPRFVETLLQRGVVREVAQELDRRIHIIETEELHDESRARSSFRELAPFLGCIVGILLLSVLGGTL